MRSARLIRFVDNAVVATGVRIASWLRPPRAAPAHGQGAWVAIKLVGIGDAVLMLPALAAIRAAGQRVVVVTTRRCAGLFAAAGCVDQLLVLDGPRALPRLWRALHPCAGVLDFEQHVYWSAAVAMLAPAKTPRYGFRTRSRTRTRAYDCLVDPGEEPRHMKEIFDDLARAAGFQPARELCALPAGAGTEARVEAWLATHALRPGAFLAVAPGSGPSVPFRRLRAVTWVDILDRLPVDLPVVLVGAASDAPLVTEIAQLAGRTRTRIVTALEFSLPELAAMFARAAVVAAIDSGPMHVAAAMNCAVVGIFGPDTPRRYAPYNERSVSVTLGLACSPCNNCWVYREPRCTNPDAYACMQRMAPEPVAAAILARLAAASGSAPDARSAHGQSA